MDGMVSAGAPAWILRTGGVAALLLAAGYVAMMPVFAAVGAPPSGTEARLAYHATTANAWWSIIALSVATDLLFLPVAVALHTALRRTNEPAMLLATAFTFLFVTLDLAVMWPAHASLIALGEQYATATTELRVLLEAAAGVPAGLLDSPLPSIGSILTLSVGILVTGLVMWRGSAGRGTALAGRATALAGVATGVIGVASVPASVVTGTVSPLAIIASLLTIAWLFLVGRELLIAARSPA
jgi:hypothetical protein